MLRESLTQEDLVDKKDENIPQNTIPSEKNDAERRASRAEEEIKNLNLPEKLKVWSQNISISMMTDLEFHGG